MAPKFYIKESICATFLLIFTKMIVKLDKNKQNANKGKM
jgi:hypothetical protein